MIFLDTSFLISFFVEKEKNHDRALRVAIDIKDEDKSISRSVIAETITVLKKKLPTKDIIKIYNVLNDFTVFEDSHLFDNAFKHFVKYDSEISFFDALYISVMNEKGIYYIVSCDSDFDNKDGIVRIY